MTTDERRVTLRLGARELEAIAVLRLGDETTSQTIRRALREAAARKRQRGKPQ